MSSQLIDVCNDLASLIEQCMLADRFKFKRRCDGFLRQAQVLIKSCNGEWSPGSLNEEQSASFESLIANIEQLTKHVIASKDIAQARAHQTLSITFDDALPIVSRREEIEKKINENQVIILAGETGSGKTTQIPKMCLAIGRGVFGKIGHTQPRRIAARTVANRIAEELNVNLGEEVGYQVRFNDSVTDQTKIKVMTDGILLADIQSDPFLNQYDTIIIDEAHERSLNIDFLLGYVKKILPKRPDLKVIVTSATIDLEKFSAFFNHAPIIEVSGRTYPVEVLYRSWQDEHEELTQAIVQSIEEVQQISKGKRGDILIFLSGERDIREVSHAIKKANLHQWVVVPLYARLSLAEQNKVFTPSAARKIVLATNVAETSLTVPGIRYVIDPGTARVKRYSLKNKIERLPIEAVSQASANQRKGRCGRVSEGVCIRLYSEEDFNLRPEFTDAEILRSNLAAVILQMLQMGVNDIKHFDFIDKPDSRLVSDGYKLLEELGAVNKKNRVTPIGKKMQALPLDPRFSRMIIAAEKLNCVKEILIIVSGLSIQDPRERPADKQQAADEKHRRFWDKKSDFLSYTNLWFWLEEQRSDLSQNQFKKACQKDFINFLRTREWRDTHLQIVSSAKTLGIKENLEPASFSAVHKALLAGLLSNIGHKNSEPGTRDYLGARNRKFVIFPGSSLKKAKPKWLMASQMLETSQIFAHGVAHIEPDWIIEHSQHLVKKHYFEPHYDVKTGQVKAYMRVSLFGLVIVEKQRVGYQKIDPKEARITFIRCALVEGMYRGKGAFYQKNRALIEEVETLEAKSRRRDIMVDDETIFNFYNERIPEHIVNLEGFDHWVRQEMQTQPSLLLLTQAHLMIHGAQGITQAQFPDALPFGDLQLPLVYHFEPNHTDDGVSVKVPVTYLHLLPNNYLGWLVPGMLREKCIAMVKSLPKQKRKKLVPVPDFVDKALMRLQRDNIAITEALGIELMRLADVELNEQDWEALELDDYYRMNVQVIDSNGKVIDRDRSLDKLRARYKDHVQESLQTAGSDFERNGITQWDFDTLLETIELKNNGISVKGFPALVDWQDSVELKVCDNPEDAKVQSLKGITRLAYFYLAPKIKRLKKDCLKGKDIGLTMVSLGKKDDVVDDIILSAIYEACFNHKALPRNQQAFEQLIEQGQADIVALARNIEATLVESLGLVVKIKKAMKSNKSALALALAFSDINRQLSELFSERFLFFIPKGWFFEYPRYLNAILLRIEKAPMNPQKDRIAINELSELWQKHQDRLAKEGQFHYLHNQSWQDYRWLLEELRVSLFAQTLKTKVPVSAKRVNKKWQESQ